MSWATSRDISFSSEAAVEPLDTAMIAATNSANASLDTSLMAQTDAYVTLRLIDPWFETDSWDESDDDSEELY